MLQDKIVRRFIENTSFLSESPYRYTYFIAVTHHVMDGDKSLVNDYPICVLGPFDQEIGELWNRNVWLVCAVY